MELATVPVSSRPQPVVLHVDDSLADRYRRRRALASSGFHVLEAETGRTARKISAAERPDVVLLDVRLPDTNGFELAREIRAGATAAERDIGVVLISGFFVESEFRARGLETGADAYLIEPVTDEELVATLRAVLRRVHQLRAARENERLLEAIFEYVPEGITVADAPDVRIRRVSRFGTVILDRAREELEGIPAPEHPDKWAIFQHDGMTPARPEDLPLTRAVTTGVVVTDEEWVLRRPDGRQIQILCNAGPIRDADGAITGGVIAWRDVTARRQVEDQLRRLTHELQLADRAKNDFLATVVHEIRQPIQAALGALALVKVQTDSGTGQRAHRVIERQLLGIAKIAEDLLDATRIVRGQFTLNRSRVDLVQVVRHSLETVKPLFEERGVQLTLTLPDSVDVEGDEGRLQQVFVNLLSNSARYTPSGGRADVTMEAAPAGAVVRVTDTGEGIAPERLSNIFELFARATDRPGGFGIGLAVVRALVEAHGGSVTASSTGPGTGSEFTVRLPLRGETLPV